MEEVIPELRRKFHLLFIIPFASHLWSSNRGRSHWVELEGWLDSLAGPLSSITNTGGCGYIYPRNDHYFEAVSDPYSLKSYLLKCHAGLVMEIENFTPTDCDEASDLAFMYLVAEQIHELVEQAYHVEELRWQIEGRTKFV